MAGRIFFIGIIASALMGPMSATGAFYSFPTPPPLRPLPVRCFSCMWMGNSTLSSILNESTVCHPHSVRYPIHVEICADGCATSTIYTNESLTINGSTLARVPISEIIRHMKLPKSVHWKGPHTFEDFGFNVTLPPLAFFRRGCAIKNNTGCFMDMSRPGIFHQDCFCHRDFCNGTPRSIDHHATAAILSVFLPSFLYYILKK